MFIKSTVTVLLSLLLLCGCSSTAHENSVDTVPPNARIVYTQTFLGETGENIAHGNWEVDESGYFIIAFSSLSGKVNNLEIYNALNSNNILVSIDKLSSDGMYETSTVGNSGGRFGLRMKKARNFAGELTVYFVAE